MAALALPAPDYHPAWVYHGCLIGTAAAAAALVEGIVAGPLLGPAARAQLCTATPVPAVMTPPPWTAAGYGLGLMLGTLASGGTTARVLGHSGGGPGSAAAAYRFPDLPGAPTVAVFGPSGAACEAVALALALAATG